MKTTYVVRCDSGYIQGDQGRKKDVVLQFDSLEQAQEMSLSRFSDHYDDSDDVQDMFDGEKVWIDTMIRLGDKIRFDYGPQYVIVVDKLKKKSNGKKFSAKLVKKEIEEDNE